MNAKYWMVAAAGIALLGYAAATIYQAPDTLTDAATSKDAARISVDEVEPKSERLIIAQGYSTRCLTPTGSCTLKKPQPVGSRCECPGKGYGKVVR